MRSTWTFPFLLLALLALVAISGCSSPESDPAAAAVTEFYGALNEGDHDRALGHYSEQLGRTLGDPESGFDEWAAAETKEGSISRIEISEAEEVEGEKTVTYVIRYEDGSSAPRSVGLTETDGEWKLGFIR